MENIRKEVKSVLPMLSEPLLDAILERLRSKGVDTRDDLQFVQEDDIVDLIKPIHCRRLLCTWKETEINPDTVTTQSRSIGDASPSGSKRHGTTTSNWPETIDISGIDMPDHIAVKLEAGERLSPTERSNAIRGFVSLMMKHDHNPIRSKCDIVARRIVSEWPQSFCDMNEDRSKLGSGHYSLLAQMKTRVEHVNRNNTLTRHRTSRKPKEGSNKVTKPTDVYGCIKWQPSLPKGETLESLGEKKESLKDIYTQRGPEESSTGEIDILMDHTYYLQRKMINGAPLPVSELKEQWPYLFVPEFFQKHFKTLTGIDIATSLLKSLQEKGLTILRFLAKEKWEDHNKVRPLIHQVVAEKDAVDMHTVAGAVIKGMMSYFKEKEDSLILNGDVTATPEEIEEETRDHSESPYLVIQGDDTTAKWMVVVEKKVIGKSTQADGVICGVAYLLCTYYNLNLQYQSNASTTLEFIQR
ncbi:uncharacterized protein LOC105444030 isoform X2 [Strongylocentrotus purpuratus]|nr:uncharacterized protein LOC105444030 isoform X2 [Strongylocentrotus purpuratus]